MIKYILIFVNLCVKVTLHAQLSSETPIKLASRLLNVHYYGDLH